MKILLNPENNIYGFNMNLIILYDDIYTSYILYCWQIFAYFLLENYLFLILSMWASMSSSTRPVIQALNLRL